MASTARAGLPFPAPSDANNVPADMEALADRVDLLTGATPVTELERDALAGDDRFTGRIVFNVDAERVEVFDGDDWVPVSADQDAAIIFAIALGG